MKKQISTEEVVAVTAGEPKVHPLLKSHMVVSKRHVDYNNLTAFEAASMSAVFVLAVLVGVVQATVIG